MVDFKGKRFLLTHWALAVLGGSENNILQMAEYIKSQGGEVEFFTYVYADPLKSIIESREIPVKVDDIDLLDNNLTTKITYDLKKIDYVIICQNIIPIDIIKKFNTINLNTKFIFWHMSSLIGIAMEAPLLYELELKIADKVLTISEEMTTEQLERILGKDIKNLTYFRNPVPDSFINSYKEREFPKSPKRIAVISNHPPKEIIGLLDEAEVIKNNIKIDFIGRWNNNEKLVTPELLSEYDIIISIGKTVQYCLVCGVPVYIYDRFGGQGYMTNYESAKRRNFSGRDSHKKATATIASELLNGYQNAIKYHKENLQIFRNEFLLSNNIASVFSDEKKKSLKIKLSKEYINYLISIQLLFKEKMTNMIYAQELSASIVNKDKLLLQKERDLSRKADRLNELLSIKRSAKLFAGNLKRRIRYGKNRIESNKDKK